MNALTVKELIKKLQEVEDKEVQVMVEIKGVDVNCYDGLIVLPHTGEKFFRIEI